MTITHHDFDLRLEKRAPHEFTAYVPDEAGGRAAEHHFGLRLDTLKMREHLRRLEAYALHGELVRDDFHAEFGRMLYGLALGGDVGALFAAQLATAQADDAGLRLRVRVDEGAPELMNLPWEFLHHGDDFLVTRWETPISRLPLGVARRTVRPLTRALRMLVVVSSPVNLPNHQVLNTEREQEVILAALDKLQRERVVEVDFCEDATLDTIQDYLSEQEYDVLHFTGHGVYREERGQGYLLLEDEQGNMAEVANTDVADLLRNVGRSLRLVVLSACQSARTSNNDAYAGLARRLMRQGVSAVLSMQYAVLDRAATDFAGRFYTDLAHNKPVDVALTEGRLGLRLAARAAGEDGGQRVDFATPVLFLNDPACVTVEAIRPVAEELALDKPLDFGTVSVMEKNFVGRQREMRRIRQGFTRQRKRAFIIHGLGGIGKSVLATRAATKLARHFHGVKAIKATPTLRPEDVLSELNAFLNLAGINQLNPVIHAPMRLADKTAVMAQILNQVPFLVIFDNFEDVLVRGRAVREGQSPAPSPKVGGGLGRGPAGERVRATDIADPALAGFFEQLLQGVAKETKFLFTSRYDFDPLGGRLTGEVGRILLGELPFPMAVHHMSNHDALAPLPVVPPQRARLPGDLALAEDVGAGVSPAQVPPITKRELYRKLGGHPYAIDVFARRAAVTTVADALLEIADVEREMIEFTLLERTYAQLPPRAQTLLMRASVYEEDVPLEGLQWMMGDQREAMPAVDAELRALLGWGMLARKEVGDEVVYPMHALVRDYARRRCAESPEDERALLMRAAKFWELRAQQTHDLGDLLRAREYYYRAGDYENSHRLFRGTIHHYLTRWGHIELAIKLWNETIATSEGVARARDIGELANIYQAMGDYRTALKLYEDILEAFEAADDKLMVASTLHGIGLIHQLQGNYAEAQAWYEQSLAINMELGDKRGIANPLGQLGTIHQAQGNYREAQKKYEECLEISMELGDKNGIAQALHGLGTINQDQGNYAEAQARYEQSLAIAMELGDKRGIAYSLGQLGMIHRDQGNYAEAQARYEQSLAMLMELGDKRGIASSLHQLGMIHEEQGSYAEAFEKYAQALVMFEQLGSPHARTARGSLARLRGKMGEEAWGEAVGRSAEGYPSADR